MYPIEVGETI